MGVINMVIRFHENMKQELINYFEYQVEKGEGFSITLDEYTYLQNRRYMNINIQ